MRILPSIKTDISTLKVGYSKVKEKKSKPKNFWFVVCLFSIIGLSLITTLLISFVGAAYAFLLVAILIALPIAVAVIAYPKFGILVILVASYLIMWIANMLGVEFPMGTLMDGIAALLILGFFLFQKYYTNWKIFKNLVALMILIWAGYSILQIANPTTETRAAWIYTVRPLALYPLMYFIFSYHINTKVFLKLILKVWIGLTFFAALYAFKQEHYGFFAFESRNHNDPLIISLLFINGVWRKFSIFTDPVAFSYNMVISTVFCMALLTGPISKNKKIILVCLSIFFINCMLYSATRAAYILIPAAFILYVTMNLSRKVITMAVIGGMFMFVVINIPTGNVTLYRFQSAFKPSDDASYNVRKMNQKRVQPYILAHPMGGGLGSTGASGVKYAPNSYLATLPPDSGFMKVAAELGWIGLLLFCGLLFTILRQGILNYYLIKDPELKAICLGMTLVVFALDVACYPQEALVQFPVNIFFYFFIAVINITLRLDKEEQAQKALAI